jgi:TatD family-associated radical SAM protein
VADQNPLKKSGIVKNQQVSYQIGEKLYLNITNSCTMDCVFCPKNRGDNTICGYNLTLETRPSADEIIASIGDPSRFSEVVFCGFGEPTLRLNIVLEVAAYIKAHKGRTRLDTDGLANLVHKEDVLPLLAENIDSLSVSLTAQNEDIFDFYCLPGLPGSYKSMLEFLQRAPRYIGDVTATAIEGLEGIDISACPKMAMEMGVKFRKRILDEVECTTSPT